MIRFNIHKMCLRSSFALIEAILALVVMGILLVSIFALQQSSMQASFSAANSLIRILQLKNVLYDPAIMREHHDQERKTEQTIKEPFTRIKLIADKPKLEALSRYELELIRAQASWDEFWGPKEESLVLLKFLVPERSAKK